MRRTVGAFGYTRGDCTMSRCITATRADCEKDGAAGIDTPPAGRRKGAIAMLEPSGLSYKDANLRKPARGRQTGGNTKTASLNCGGCWQPVKMDPAGQLNALAAFGMGGTYHGT